jgi:hypothetical protein
MVKPKGFYPSGVLKNQVPALRACSVVNGGPYPSTVDYFEPAYYACTALGADLVLDFQLPLRLLKGTIFADNHNFYAGNISFLKLYFGPLDKIGYFSTSNAHPSAGVRTVLNTAATITNLNLYSAVEKNDSLAMAKKAEIAAGKEMYINTIFCNKVSNQGVNQSIPVILSNGQGSYLNWILHSVYNINETLDTAYDNCNDDSDATINVAKVQQFNTSLGGRPVQSLVMDCTTATGQFTDWLQMKHLLKNSVISSRPIYANNWFFLDDYSNFSPEHMQGDNNSLIAGRPIQAIPLTWSFNGKVMTPAQYQHYTWACITRTIRFQGGQVLVL